MASEIDSAINKATVNSWQEIIFLLFIKGMILYGLAAGFVEFDCKPGRFKDPPAGGTLEGP